VRVEPDRIVLLLSDGTEEPWDPGSTREGPGGALYATVKRAARGGPYEAKFSPHAQSSLLPVLVEDAGAAAVTIGGKVHPIGAKTPAFG
jgi:hypothetical protein